MREACYCGTCCPASLLWPGMVLRWGMVLWYLRVCTFALAVHDFAMRMWHQDGAYVVLLSLADCC